MIQLLDKSALLNFSPSHLRNIAVLQLANAPLSTKCLDLFNPLLEWCKRNFKFSR